MWQRIIHQPTRSPTDGPGPMSAGARLRRAAGQLYPAFGAHADGWLEVGDGHTLAWSDAGARDGIPAVYLHGGPGAASMPLYRRFFDPDAYRVVMVDQRGAGRSRPHANLDANTTDHLIADLERLRRHLGIESWVLFGGSWGSTLALAYAEAHPERCLGLVLRGVFLGTMAEVRWFLDDMGRFFPQAASDFRAAIPAAERADMLAAYHRRLIDPDPAIHLPAARAWSAYEASCSTLFPQTQRGMSSDQAALALSRIEAHYFANELFLAPDQLMRELPAITHLPAWIVQGRYDIVCPPMTAQRLADAWPGAHLRLIDDAGHSAMEPGIRAALVEATDALKTIL